MSDYLATVDPYGSQDTYYTYVEGHWYIADGTGWYDDSEVMDDVVLNTNQGLMTQSWMNSPFQFAGEVQKGEAELYLYDGLPAYTGNFTAADLTLGDFVAGGDWDAGMSDYVATIDPYGSQEVYYTYVDGNWYVADGTGWYDDSEVMNDVEIPANKGLMIQTWIDTSTINIPMPVAE